jgi:predicted nucleic acid-binding protein
MTRLPAASGLRSASRDAVLLDTGFLVSLIDDREPLHAEAVRWLSRQHRELWSVPAVMTETAHFVPGWLRPQLARAASSGLLRIAAPEGAGYGRIAWLLEKYAGLSPDWADCELLWLAETAGIHRIATLDTTDFGVYRIRGRKAFDIVWPPRAA